VDIGTAVASAWSSGISVYAVAVFLGVGGRLDWVESPEFLQRPWVIAGALALFVIEFIIAKTAYLDSAWDTVHGFIRPVAGALLLETSDASAGTFLLVVSGATLALLAHGAKASIRVLVNTSPEPVSNVFVSLTEDGIVAALMTFALAAPEVAFVIAIVLATLSAIVVFLVVRTGRRILRGRRRRRDA
jgi:uncharacterized MnhB-related membrane protein